jgi:hypothetical protein
MSRRLLSLRGWSLEPRRASIFSADLSDVFSAVFPVVLSADRFCVSGSVCLSLDARFSFFRDFSFAGLTVAEDTFPSLLLAGLSTGLTVAPSLP